jgi:tetratricopeptide (TPR) repeat protein
VLAAMAVVMLIGLPAARAQLKRDKEKIKVRGKHKVRSRAAVKRRTAAKKIRAEEFMIAKIKRKVTRIIQRQMGILKRRLKYTPEDDSKYPEYLFRLATLRNEMQNDQWMKGMALDEKIFRAEERGNKGAANRYRRKKKAFMKAHKLWLKSALMTFRKITVKFPKYSRMDEVYFHISNTAKKLVEREKDPNRKKGWQQVMLTYFKKLLQQFPKSKYVPDALLAYAEHSFNTRQFGAALQLYKRITQYKRSPVRPYAIYKIGWVYLNLKQYHKAMGQFLKVLRLKGTKLNLVNEARKDIVRTFAHVGKVDAALNFFRRPVIGGPKNVKWMMVMLGDVYYGQGKNDEAIAIYTETLRQWPRDKDRCKWGLSLVDAAINIGNKDRQVKAIRTLGKISKSVTKQFGKKNPITKECRASSANIMKMLATQWHSEAQKTKNFQTLDKAQYLYETYIKSFPDSPDVYIMTYYYADLLFMLGEMLPDKANWPKTAEAFNAVVKMKKPKKMSRKEYVKRRNSAALAAVNCWMKHFNVSAKKLTDKPKELKKKKKKCIKRKRRKCVKWKRPEIAKKPIPADRQKMIEAFNTYTKFVPKSEWLVKIKYNKALIYYNYNHFEKALPLFMDIATKHQEDEEPARYAALRVIAILKMKKRFGKMKRYIDEFIKSEKLMADMMFKSKMQEYKRNAMWEEAEKLKAAKKYKQAGELFEEIARTYPQDDRLDDIYWNAGICYEAARLIGRAVMMRKLLRAKRPKSDLAPKALYFIGGNYHALAFYEEAAQHYEQFAKENKKDKDAPRALKYAILFRWGTGNINKMMRDVEDFIKAYHNNRKHRDEAAEVHFWVHRIHEDREGKEAETKLISHLNQYLSRWARHGGLDRRVQALAKLGKIYWERSCKREMVDGMCVKITYKRRKRRKKLAHKKKRVRYLPRERRMARAAKKKFQKVVRLWGPKGPGARMAGKTPAEKKARTQAALYWVAMSRFMLIDMQFEDYMKLDLPRKLNFNPRYPRKMKRAQKKFAAWAENKAKGLSRLRKRYEQVIVLKQAHWAIAATARIGMLFHNFARQLFDAPIPSHLRTDMEKNAYRDELQKYADPLLMKAKQGYFLCLKTAKQYNWFNEWSRLCEKEINDLEPEKFPLTMELRAQPGYVSTALSPGAVVTKVD